MRFTSLNLAGVLQNRDLCCLEHTGLHDEQKLFDLGLSFFFFFKAIKPGDANTAVEMQAVPYFALCIIKKIASSVLISQSSLWWCS